MGQYTKYFAKVMFEETTECLRCGYCCKKAICYIGYMNLPDEYVGQKPDKIKCPFLDFNGTQYGCKLAATHGKDLLIGVGCCCALNSDRMEMQDKLRGD